MKEITTREDIELLVKEFYSKVSQNETLGYIFNDVIQIDWDKHIPKLVNFWETILLNKSSYFSNTMGVHFEINQKVKLEPIHFRTWLALFDSTVDEHFYGEKADLSKKRAHMIGDLMQLKMEEINKTSTK